MSTKKLKYGIFNPTSINNVELKPDVEDDNFVDINNLTRQYFLLMMNVLESPLLGSFLSQNKYRETVELEAFDSEGKKDLEVDLKPEKRWKVQTTPFTKSLLTDGAIMYKAFWNDERDNEFDEKIWLDFFFKDAIAKVLKEDISLQVALVVQHIEDKHGGTGDVGYKNIVRKLIIALNEDRKKSLSKSEIFTELLESSGISIAPEVQKAILAYIEQLSGDLSLIPKGLMELVKASLKKLKQQEVNLNHRVILKGLKRYIEEDEGECIYKEFDKIIKERGKYYTQASELFFVVPHVPDSKKKEADFDVMTFIGKVFYEVSKTIKGLGSGLRSLLKELGLTRKEIVDSKTPESDQEYIKLLHQVRDRILKKPKDDQEDEFKYLREFYGTLNGYFKETKYKDKIVPIMLDILAWEFDFIAYRKMNGCSWMIPQDATIKMDPNLLWPKLDVAYTAQDEETKENKDYLLKVENIANGIKWKRYEKLTGIFRVEVKEYSSKPKNDFSAPEEVVDDTKFFFEKEGQKTELSLDALDGTMFVTLKPEKQLERRRSSA